MSITIEWYEKRLAVATDPEDIELIIELLFEALRIEGDE
jgi:hypothetical protein